jgi:hypothetical protein
MDRYLFTGTIRQMDLLILLRNIVGDFSCLWLRMDSKEDFMANVKELTLKLRGGWGVIKSKCTS